MLISKICIITGGILSLLMVMFHTRFYKLFDWKKDFEKISIKNQKIFYTIHLALADDLANCLFSSHEKPKSG